ncbi:MAG: transcription antitermination factor NusB [Peptoniphilus sp.]|uniref:Transcription antitermination protein NusB n=2 Tax=Peptoniphilus indolicus TaxID=33030 RepID=G4D6N0_9FIRM|nr:MULTISPECIES: transcription antitermination factor NusB [Peptoniphilus]EGY76457.1 N utilization substance protein B [Peptoniphilus indolicus ATCC 29427]MDY2987185.1 transcription antitermination factor NusB [Peptoniphilus sp.]SUB76046.1 N utilization substance protein B homolog [Peptoniphilus indolicus]
MSRKKARIGQMQLLYQMDLTNKFDIKEVELFLDNFSFSDDEIEYINVAIPQLIDNIEEIDSVIEKNLEKWSFKRLAKVDRAILRIAVFEMLYREDIPEEVSINEAIEIAKVYGSLESQKFINGILGSIYRSIN